MAMLAKRVNTYYVAHEDFYDGLTNEHGLIVFDEFRRRDLSTFNMIAGGQPGRLRIKGGQFFKTSNCPVIVCSNFSPQSLYPDATELSTILSRFIVIDLEDPIQVEEITFE